MLARSVALLVCFATLADCAPEQEPVASLRVTTEDTVYRVTVGSFDHGYPVRFHCESGCTQPVDVIVESGNHPLGLFRRDDESIVYFTSSGGSAYRVQAWRLKQDGIEAVLNASSRSRPEFLNSPDGSLAVRTTEASGGLQPQERVLWRLRGGAFVRSEGDEG